MYIRRTRFAQGFIQNYDSIALLKKKKRNKLKRDDPAEAKHEPETERGTFLIGSPYSSPKSILFISFKKRNFNKSRS